MDPSVKIRESREIPSPILLGLLEHFYEGDEFQSEETTAKLRSSTVPDKKTPKVSSDFPKAETAGPSNNCTRKGNENIQVKFSEVQEVQLLLDDFEDWKISEINKSEKFFDFENKDSETFRAHERKSVKFLLPFNVSTFNSTQEKKKWRLTPLTPYNVTYPNKDFEAEGELANESFGNGEECSGCIMLSPFAGQKNAITPNPEGVGDERCETTFDFAEKAFDAYSMAEENGASWLSMKLESRRRSEGMLGIPEPLTLPEHNHSSATDDEEINCCCFNLS